MILKDNKMGNKPIIPESATEWQLKLNRLGILLHADMDFAGAELRP